MRLLYTILEQSQPEPTTNGLVLFEVGAWRSLQDFKRPEDSRHTLRQYLLQKYIPRLGTTIGAIYRDAVLACLSDEFAISEGHPKAIF